MFKYFACAFTATILKHISFVTVMLGKMGIIRDYLCKKEITFVLGFNVKQYK